MEWGAERLEPNTILDIDAMLAKPWPQPIPGTRLEAFLQPYPKGAVRRDWETVLLTVETSDEAVCITYLLCLREIAAEKAWLMITDLAYEIGVPHAGTTPEQTPWLIALLMPLAVTVPPETLPLLADFAACLATRICQRSPSLTQDLS